MTVARAAAGVAVMATAAVSAARRVTDFNMIISSRADRTPGATASDGAELAVSPRPWQAPLPIPS